MTAYVYKDEWDTEFGIQFDLCAAGFKERGLQVRRYTSPDELTSFGLFDVHYGPSDDLHRLLNSSAIAPDYPEPVEEFTLPRSRCALSEAPEEYPFFIKPVEHKLFKGLVAQKPQDLSFIEGDPQIWIGEYVEIPSEWRAYVHRNEVVKLCHYAGDPLILPDLSLIQELVHRLRSAWWDKGPVMRAYALDISPTHLIEVNDILSIGNYGLDGVTFSEMIEDRWMQVWQ